MAPFGKCANIIVLWWYILLMSASSATGKNRPIALSIDEDSPTSDEKDLPNRCWVFHHMVKSGGTTVKNLLDRFGDRNNIQRSGYFNDKWLDVVKGARSSENVIATGQGIIYGGYAEALRPIAGSENCKWFTVFRHPISRLVSAFFYCKYVKRNDSLCSQTNIDLDTTDVVSFAEHWGNFGLRQYALAFLSNEDILSSHFAQDCKACPGWYIEKRYLQSLQQQILNGTFLTSNSTDEYSLYMMLEPTLEIITSRYTVVGLLEDYATTMRLFDSALGMDNFNWTVESQRVGARNEDLGRKAEEHAALDEAWTNPTIIQYIWLDLILYEHATKIFAKQVKQYGLGEF